MRISYLNKFFVVLLIALFCFNLPVYASNNAGSKTKIYEVEKICIEYELTGMQKGKQTTYIRDWGNEEVTVLEGVVEMGPISQKTHTATYKKDGKIYTVDLGTNTGNVTDNPILEGMTEEEQKEFGEKLLKEMGKEIGTEEFLGQTCRVFEMKGLGTKTWIWKNIALKSETGLGPMKQNITGVKITYDFDEKIFDLPKDIKFEEGPNLQDIMKKMQGQ